MGNYWSRCWWKCLPILFNIFYCFLLNCMQLIQVHYVYAYSYHSNTWLLWSLMYTLYAFVKSRHRINRQTFPQIPMSVSSLNKPRILTVSFKKYHRFTLSLETFSASEIHYPAQNSCLSCVPTPYSRQLFCEIVHLRIGVHGILKNKRW